MIIFLDVCEYMEGETREGGRRGGRERIGSEEGKENESNIRKERKEGRNGG